MAPKARNLSRMEAVDFCSFFQIKVASVSLSSADSHVEPEVHHHHRRNLHVPQLRLYSRPHTMQLGAALRLSGKLLCLDCTRMMTMSMSPPLQRWGSERLPRFAEWCLRFQPEHRDCVTEVAEKYGG